MDFDKYMDEWDEFEKYAKEKCKDNLEEIKLKYALMDEDFAEALFDEWDEMNLRCNWNCMTPTQQ